MMTIDEAIQHCKEKSCGNSVCALEHKQLAEWLEELRHYRSIWKDPSKEKPNAGEIVLVQYNDWNMYIGRYYKDEDGEGIYTKPHNTLTWVGRCDAFSVKAWTYPKYIFPFLNKQTLRLSDYRNGEPIEENVTNTISQEDIDINILIADRLRMR